MMKRIISIETSQFDPEGHWVYGGEYYAVDATIEYDDALDELDDEDLMEIADDDNDPRAKFVGGEYGD